MPGTGFSGKDGDVKIGSTAISEIKGWTFNPKANNVRYASNATGGYKRTVAGVKEGSGTCNGVFTAATSFHTVIDVGTGVDLKLYLNATLFYTVPAVISDYKLTVDLDSGEIVGWEASWETNGAWTNSVSSMMASPDMLPMSSPVSPSEFEEGKLQAAGDRILEKSANLDPKIMAAIKEAVKTAVSEVSTWKELADLGVLQRDLSKEKKADDVTSAAIDHLTAASELEV